jgi:hypothetical protein
MAVATKNLLVSAIRSTLQQLELDPEVRADDPAFDTLKRLLVRRIAEINDPREGTLPETAIPETSE